MYVDFKRGVLITKDNLAKQKLEGSKICAFCSKPETIKHLFFECYYARFIWSDIHIVLGIPSPQN